MIDGEALRVGMRAVMAVAAADGQIDERERGLLRAAVRGFMPGATAIDVDSISAIEPADAARRVQDVTGRERIIQAQLVMSLIDGDADERELAVIRAFADAFAVQEPRLDNLSQLVNESYLLLKLDLNRHSQMTSEAVSHAYREQGLRGVWKSTTPFLSKHAANDAELAAKYHALGELPEGTFGRVYHEHMTSRGFSFPGEPSGFPEVFMKHDACHVLGGYDTDPTGECEVVAFICGFMQTDPFWYLFMILVHMHLGIETFQDNALGELAFDADRVLAALLRGTRVAEDIYAPGYDFWALFPRPLDAVRSELSIST